MLDEANVQIWIFALTALGRMWKMTSAEVYFKVAKAPEISPDLPPPHSSMGFGFLTLKVEKQAIMRGFTYDS
jgi:hypothetical protein